MSKMTQANEDLQKELQAKKLEILRLQHEFANSLDHTDTNKRLTDHIIKLNEESETELFSAKKTLNKQEREMERLLQEVEQYRQNDKKQKLRIKQLEMDLENALKKTSTKGISERLYSGHSRSRGNSPALSSKRSVSVPHKPGFSTEKRKNSTNLSTLSNKNKYSRENSVASEHSGFVGRWNRRNSPDVSNNKAKRTSNLTPIRKNSKETNTNKPFLSNNNNKKNFSMNNNKAKNSYNSNLNNKKTSNPGGSGKKYEKPWLVSNNNAKKSSPLPKLTGSNSRNHSNTKKSYSEEDNLYKKLEDLRAKNRRKEPETKENTRKLSNKENNLETNIDERLNKLQNLLKIAKN